jgi:hypothetical protein
MAGAILSWAIGILTLANINETTPMPLVIINWVVAILFVGSGSYTAWKEASKE